MHSRILRAQIAAVCCDTTPHGRPPFAAKGHARAISIAVGFDAAQLRLEPVVARSDLIEQQPHRPIGVGHHDIDIAVVIDIAESRAAVNMQLVENAAGRNFAIGFSLVMKKLAALPEWKGSAALRVDDTHFAVGNKQVHPTVIVNIGCHHSPRLAEMIRDS